MGLSFLVPLFLALGVAALAIPLWVHLRRRHERREVPFPSLMFLREIPFRSEARRTLQNRLLLAARILAFLILAAAFARPFLQGDATAATATVGPREVVVLLDRSYSMGYGDRWEEARSLARRAVAGLGTRDRASLVLFDEGADAPVRSATDPSRVRAAVTDAAPGDGATRYAPALRLARSLLEASALPNLEVVMVSDFQAVGWSADEQVRLPARARLHPRPVGGSEPWANRSLASVRVERARTGGRETAAIGAAIVERGGGEVPGGEVVFVVEGRERERIPLASAGGDRLEFGPVALADRPLRATVRLSPDRLPADDAHFLVLAPGRRLRVLVLEGSGAAPEPDLYLRRALELSRDPPVEVLVRPVDALAAESLAAVDVVVLNDAAPPVGAGGRALGTFVENGGGLMVAGGPGAAARDVEGLLPARLGPSVDPPSGGTLLLGAVDRRHPVFAPFRAPGTGNFAAARFYRVRRLVPDDSARVLARFDDGEPALLEGRTGEGRVLIWGSTLHTLWTDLPLQPVFLPFVQRAIRHLAGRGESSPSYRVGDVLAPDAAETSTGRISSPVAVVGPDGERRTLDDAGGGAFVLRAAGIHEITGDPDGQARGRPVAVNVDPSEGDLTPIDVEELVAAVIAPEAATAEDEGDAAATVAPEDQERHQGLWRFLLGAAFLLLTTETVLG
nr:VWA domain-containing protein [Gemmatimonadota bacterium]NIR79523.1 VWA domain-containing protein [Gemmatimonadota bacterium]NIT88199.1 VWA domain-containing protein [Gemmatimonadota bacterium]NIU32007.1 VWA domain-containing protein [Gemmatimonadota bacterium]NIU36616.1 VWA domain-containing protein [Gemmatimonadota bacterium]